MMCRMWMAAAACAAVAVLAAPSLATAQEKISRPGQYQGYAEAAYDGHERTSFYLPVRDGTRLAVDLFRPTRAGQVAGEKLPVVWMHTPYNRRDYAGGATVERYPGYALKLVKYGYNVAVVDFRGLYASFGRNTGYNRGEWADAARFDAYDVTEWLAAQPWSNGRIGMWGCSATGGSQMQAATTRPPSLKAIFPMSAELDAYAFAVMGGVSRGAVAAPNRGAATDPNAARDAQAAPVDGPQGAALLAEAIAGHRDNIESPGVVPFRDSRSPTMDVVWWEKSSPSTWLADLKASGLGVYAVANWDEAGTRHGAPLTFRNLGEGQAKLLIGPATHCAWSAVREETGFDLVTEELRFFDHWLKGVDNGVMDEPAVTYFTYNAPKESAWRTSNAWPLPNEVRTDFFLGAGTLATAGSAPGRDAAALAAPAPSQSTMIAAPQGGLAYETAPLPADLEVTGHPEMRLWIASPAAGDADVLARIEDVAPDGTARSYQMLGRLRASHRALGQAPYDAIGLPWPSHVSTDARLLPPGEPVELAFELLPMSYIFKAGHKLRLTVSFTSPDGTAGAPVQVLRGGPHASRLVLPVVN